MKTSSIILLFSLFISLSLFAQDASTYFPQNPGSTWEYKVTPLDSAGGEIAGRTTYGVDSFVVVQNYQGRSANVIVSKRKDSPDGQYLEGSDTSYVSFEGSDALTYFQLNIDSLIGGLSSSTVLSKKLNISNVGGWFAFFRFAQNVNESYSLFSLDTTINFSSIPLIVHYEVSGVHLADQTIQTDAGGFDCKKFVVNNLIQASLATNPPTPFTSFTISDTSWVALNQWIVMDILAPTTINLGFLGSQHINGTKKILIKIPTDVNEAQAKINEFRLYQNYPNPFNPSTTIRYSLAQNTNVELTVYDLLGNKIVSLVNKEQNAGNYEVVFNPSDINSGLSSGIYFYKLRAGNGTITKKLIYLK